jgi:glycosyltransferase involved in cell wall biosynthesis
LEVPIVVTNVGALADAVQHNKTGIVVKPCDVNDLANGIMELHSDKKKLNAMRDNIREEWMKSMSWEPIADDYLKCYEARI